MLDKFRPSEYTAALIQTLFGMRQFVNGASVVEIGCGSGVVLAALATMGANTLCGVDVELAALQAGEIVVQSVGGVAEFRDGDLWQPLKTRRFDLIVANLPHFPTESGGFSTRLPSWSDGGRDGRRLLDPFIDGLPRHLSPTGRAVITHNAFVDLRETRRRLAQYALSVRVACTVLLVLSDEKVRQMSSEILGREEGRTIHRIGPYCFAQMHVLDIRTRSGRS